MITRLGIKNFKSHKNTEIGLNKLTVLTGVNGCGKTSVIQAFLLLRQTYQKGRLMDGLDLNKPLCNIGIGNDALYRLATEGELAFDISDDTGENFSFVFDADINSLTDSFLKKKSYSNNISNDRLDKISLFNNEFQYISASRWGGRSIFPKETYAAETQKQISLECGQGELIAQYLYKFGNNDVTDYTDEKKTDLSLLSQTIWWEQKISSDITLNVEPGKDNNSFSITYGYNDIGQQKAIQDLKAENVGYGISYTLPVVVALLSAKPGAMIIIENPEAHLHPAGQAELARLITMVASTGVQVVVETHSDHIISGIQLACKANTENAACGINKDNVSMYHLYNQTDRSLKIDRVKILGNGRLDYQPKGFFDQTEMDMFELLRN
jgi:predicted ATPase